MLNGSGAVGADKTPVIGGQMAVLGPAQKMIEVSDVGVTEGTEVVELEASKQGMRCVVIAGQPLNEPIARYGPVCVNHVQQ